MSELGSRNSPRSGLARGMDAHALARAPVPGVYLLYDFHTAAEESYLLSRVDNEPKTRWTTVSDRRVLQFGGRPTATKHGMIAEKKAVRATRLPYRTSGFEMSGSGMHS